MRTTLTLEPDIADRVNREMRRTGKGMKQVVDEALRFGLGLAGRPAPPKPLEVRPHSFVFTPGIDLDRMNQLVDELVTKEVVRKLRP
jgi:hypothetical protein